MPRDLKDILAEAFPGAEIKRAERHGAFIVTSADVYLRVQELQSRSEVGVDLGSFANMTARPGVGC